MLTTIVTQRSVKIMLSLRTRIIILFKGCITTAADILDNLDDSVDPCDDFYQFACGGYIERTVIPDDHTRVNQFSTLDDKLNEQVAFA